MRYIVKLTDWYATGMRDWDDRQEYAYVFEEETAAEFGYASAKEFAETHAKTLNVLARVVRLVRR